MTEFKDMLAYLRKREGYTQQRLAKLLHVSTSTIGMYESGKRYPTREIEDSIADLFNVNINTLRGKERIEGQAEFEMGETLAKLSEDTILLDYVKMLLNADQETKEKAYSYLDFLLSKPRRNP